MHEETRRARKKTAQHAEGTHVMCPWYNTIAKCDGTPSPCSHVSGPGIGKVAAGISTGGGLRIEASCGGGAGINHSMGGGSAERGSTVWRAETGTEGLFAFRGPLALQPSFLASFLLLHRNCREDPYSRSLLYLFCRPCMHIATASRPPANPCRVHFPGFPRLGLLHL